MKTQQGEKQDGSSAGHAVAWGKAAGYGIAIGTLLGTALGVATKQTAFVYIGMVSGGVLGALFKKKKGTENNAF